MSNNPKKMPNIPRIFLIVREKLMDQEQGEGVQSRGLEHGNKRSRAG